MSAAICFKYPVRHQTLSYDEYFSHQQLPNTRFHYNYFLKKR
ncbi:uncharacterized protein METZ01_LOCUS166231 [marine metagenome]|uniref:Uncharacterized protein n=1 Tax=marine metagenome TaxID=408172 RepID=A0A382BJN1_9ZZZZ